jgi:hypothetical protein
LFLKIVVKINYFVGVIDYYDHFLFNDYDLTKNQLNEEISKLGKINNEAKGYLHIIKEGKLKELYVEYNRIMDLNRDIEDEIKRVNGIRETKLSNIKNEVRIN